MPRAPEIKEWLDGLDGDQRERAEWLAEQVHGANGELDEAVKWRRLTFTANDDWHHWLCAVAPSKRGVALTFHKGALLDDPDGILEGEGRYARSVPYETAKAQPAAVKSLVGEALARQTEMLDD